MLQYQTRCWACRVSVAVCGGVCGRNSGLQEGSRNNHTTWEDGGHSHCSSHSLCVLEPWIMGSREHRRWGGLRGMPLGVLNHKTKWCPSPTPSSQQGVILPRDVSMMSLTRFHSLGLSSLLVLFTQTMIRIPPTHSLTHSLTYSVTHSHPHALSQLHVSALDACAMATFQHVVVRQTARPWVRILSARHFSIIMT